MPKYPCISFVTSNISSEVSTKSPLFIKMAGLQQTATRMIRRAEGRTLLLVYTIIYWSYQGKPSCRLAPSASLPPPTPAQTCCYCCYSLSPLTQPPPPQGLSPPPLSTPEKVSTKHPLCIKDDWFVAAIDAHVPTRKTSCGAVVGLYC